MNEFDGVAVETGEVDYTDTDDTAEGAAGLQEDEVMGDDNADETGSNEEGNEDDAGKIPNDVWKTSRLRAEREADERYQKKVDDFYRKVYAGYVNPFTGRAIESEADYIAYTEQAENEEKNEKLKASGIDRDTLLEVIGELPEVKAMKEIQAAQEKKFAQDSLMYCIAEIGKIDSSIKTAEDLEKSPNYEKFNAFVEKGYTLKDAFILANYERLSAGAATAAKQDAIKKIVKNGASSPGSLTGSGNDKSKIDFESMSNEDFESYYEKAVRGELRKN